MTNKEAAEVIENILLGHDEGLKAEEVLALDRALLALQHFAEPKFEFKGPPDRREYFDDPISQLAGDLQRPVGLQCLCGWRTLDTHRLLCDKCGSHELKPIYEVTK